MAREALFRIHVILDGRTDEEAAAEIRRQLAEQGWTPGEVNVSRNGDTIVSLSADDDEGHHLRLLQRRSGDQAEHLTIEPEPIDRTRAPGMTHNCETRSSSSFGHAGSMAT